ncbi:MAG: alanine racemase [Actinomycetota bacterium]
MIRFRPTVVEVDLHAIRHNVRTLKPSTAELMAVVKANAYGHGDVPVARAAIEAGATWLGVAMVEEGAALREAGIEAPVLVLSEFPPGSEKEALSLGLVPSLYTDDGLAGLEEAAASLGTGVGAHVKVDTGMHRVGLYPPEAVMGFVRRTADAGLSIAGLWTHFARAEEDPATTGEQLRRFLGVVDALASDGVRPTYLHAANSAAILGCSEAHLNLVRAGVAVYGISPGTGSGEELGLRPALTWRSAVTQVKRLPAGEAISYGHRYRLDRDSTMATVPVGYADGYSRRLSSKAYVLIRGRRHRVAGTVTMDHIMVDCGDVAVETGDEVVLLGRQGDEAITTEELARLTGTIGYEVVASIGPRTPREYVG